VWCIVSCVRMCSLVVCGSASDLREMSSWDGKGPASRCKLIHQLQGKLLAQPCLLFCLSLCVYVCVSSLEELEREDRESTRRKETVLAWSCDTQENVNLYSASSWTHLKALSMAHVLKGSRSFTCIPHFHPLTEWTIPAFSFSAKAGSHLLTSEGWNLSWPGWLVTYQNKCPVTHLSTNWAGRRLTLLIEANALPLCQTADCTKPRIPQRALCWEVWGFNRGLGQPKTDWESQPRKTYRHGLGLIWEEAVALNRQSGVGVWPGACTWTSVASRINFYSERLISVIRIVIIYYYYIKR